MRPSEGMLSLRHSEADSLLIYCVTSWAGPGESHPGKSLMAQTRQVERLRVASPTPDELLPEGMMPQFLMQNPETDNAVPSALRRTVDLAQDERQSLEVLRRDCGTPAPQKPPPSSHSCMLITVSLFMSYILSSLSEAAWSSSSDGLT
uniref:Uncharacterized protein n=1 Tax=Hanusia phi TaxID=3032 RepID=A0A7S0HTL9_9CRYP